MAFKRSLAVLLFVLATSVLASPFGRDESKSEHKECGEKEFYYPTKSCCLPHGGPHKSRSPPPGKSCPPTNWYWHTEKSCCVPRHPPPANPPPPQCEYGYEWNKAIQCCEPRKPNPPPTSPPPKVSQTPPSGNNPPPYYGYPPKEGHKDSYHGSKRHPKRSVIALCPDSFEACPVSGLSGSEYECLDTTAELRSCGGCASTGTGQDCTAIEGAWNVGCEVGTCAVYTCELGYKVAKDGKSCIRT